MVDVVADERHLTGTRAVELAKLSTLELITRGNQALRDGNPSAARELLDRARNQAADEESEIAPGETLVGIRGYDSIHNATCILEYITEMSSEYRGESPPDGEDGENLSYGRWLLDRTVVSLLRHGLGQIDRERIERERTTLGSSCS